MRNKVKQKNVALTDIEIGLVQQFANEHGLNFSAALRILVRRGAEDGDLLKMTEQSQKALKITGGK